MSEIPTTKAHRLKQGQELSILLSRPLRRDQAIQAARLTDPNSSSHLFTPTGELKGRGKYDIRRDFNKSKRSVMARRTPELERKIDLACKQMSFRALEVLDAALDPKRTPDLDYKYRIVAAKEVLDRAWGKPKQKIEAKIEQAPSDAFVAAMQKAEQRVKTDQPALAATAEALSKPVQVVIATVAELEDQLKH